MTKRDQLKIKWLTYFYGGYILEAMMLDNILENINNRGMLQFNMVRIPDKTDKDLFQNLDFLAKEGYIQSYPENYYDIMQKGKLHLASGGFTLEAKKNKNSLFAFRISIIAITITIINATSAFLYWFRTS